MGDSDETQNNMLLHSLVNQSRINESINYINLLDLMNKYNPGPPIKKTIVNDQDFVDELEQFLDQLDQPKKQKFYEESMILFDDNDNHSIFELNNLNNNHNKLETQSSKYQDGWLDKLPTKHEFDDLEELEKILSQ
ncbi:unnamed protein product (macronuclear) [Paramecium tetraurelia]|uniref:Uncharacterized protein n=1 Tax=Paramecium tetraurelia TaxID=5888 RepID=A0D3D3_PARTE|nr:uncharacterized protein GSPATT00013036001 [Paramecium tetraurelia]CAK77550.1 unnamed protein product [Paramecium tetraurelia]|eukprot:XP_001444947.1 hypothetical protein (macronuclear) [Paramecium tetraurelia strain d4-2]